MQTKRTKIQPSHDPRPRIDLAEISDKNSLKDGLVKLAHKFAKLVTETSSKVQEFKTYD